MNGIIDEAEVDALLSGDQREVDRYLLVTAIQTRKAVEMLPCRAGKAPACDDAEAVKSPRFTREQIVTICILFLVTVAANAALTYLIVHGLDAWVIHTSR